MKLAISGQALAPVKSIAEIIDILKKFDVHNIEIWTQNIPLSEGVKNSNGITGRNVGYVKKLLEDEKITPACLTFGGAFNKDFFENGGGYTKELAETVRAAKFLGAKIVNHYCYHISMNEAPNKENIKKYLSPALEEAEKYGIVLALENEAHDSTALPERMLEILEIFSSPYFKTNFDATNYYHASAEGFPYAYEVLKDYIAYVHIKNGCIYSENFSYTANSIGSPMSGANAGKMIYYPTVNDGAVNIDGLLSRLERDNYTGYITLEPHTATDDVESYYQSEIAYLRKRGYCQ